MLNATRGSTVDVSVDMSVSPGFTMETFDLIIMYDSSVFTFVATPPEYLLNQGNLLTHAFSIIGAAEVPGTLRISAFEYGFDPITHQPYPTDGEDLADDASGTLFTFSLMVNSDAALGISELTFAHENDDFSGTFGVDWGVYSDAGPVSVTDFAGSINIIPEPATMTLLGIGGLLLARKKK